MVLYLEYETFKRRLTDTQNMLDEILCEREELFAKTQPKSFDYTVERVEGGEARNKFDEYLIAKEAKQIDERLEEAKALLEDRRQMLFEKEQELRQSRDVYDRIYRMRFVDRLKVQRIASMVGYSEASVYRLLKIITIAIELTQ